MEGIVESQYPTVVLDVVSQVEAQECGFCATVETYNGGLKFRTKFVPSKILSGICYLVG